MCAASHFIRNYGETSFFAERMSADNILCYRVSLSGAGIEMNLQLFGKIVSGWHSWLRHCATSRKVVGSIPDGVIELFHSCKTPV
jgi:hypothetical protein